ncbi:MAG: CvpA family protein [Alistipes sp.]|nr:CvpA family protein [Alistipes sp.]
MVIDIVVAILAVWLFILGLRRGFIVELCHLVGIYAAVLLAPKFATQVGSLFMDDPGKAYLAGFFVIVACAVLLVWIIAPLVRMLVVWKPIRFFDSLLGGILSLATLVVVVASLLSVFDRINLGTEIRNDKLGEMFVEYEGRENELVEKLRKLNEGDVDGEMREFFHHKYISYETLASSMTYFPLVEFGVRIAPTIKQIDGCIREEADKAIREQIFFEEVE